MLSLMLYMIKKLQAIYDKKITVKDLAQKIGTDITDYNRESLL